MKISLNLIVDRVKESLEAHKLEQSGAYCRWLDRERKNNEYGCADALNVRYTINDLLMSDQERKDCVEVLRSFQQPDTGLFDEGTHLASHCTAHCIAALTLLNASPKYPLTALEKYRDPSAIVPWLEGLGYDLATAGHVAPAIFASFFNTHTMSVEWRNTFFDWLDAHADPKYGISINGAIEAQKNTVWRLMGDWFHFLFCYHAAHRPFPYAERIVDTCIDMYRKGEGPISFGRGWGYMDIDWSFSLNRALHQTGYRFDEGKSVLLDFAQKYIDYLNKSAPNEPHWNDLHMMFGMVCSLAELQIALPNDIVSDVPLRQAMDVRPFI